MRLPTVVTAILSLFLITGVLVSPATATTLGTFTVQDAGTAASSGMLPVETLVPGTFFSTDKITFTWLSGTVNLNQAPVNPDPNFAQFSFNPDGSLAIPASSENWGMYNYFKPNATGVPTLFGGDGTNHFAGGGGNFDIEWPTVAGFGFTGKHTTDTTDPATVRFGSLVGTLDGGVTWFYIGYGTTIGAGTGVPIPNGSTLNLAVFDRDYNQNTGAYLVRVDIPDPINPTPEPSTILLATAGLGLLLFSRRRQK